MELYDLFEIDFMGNKTILAHNKSAGVCKERMESAMAYRKASHSTYLIHSYHLEPCKVDAEPVGEPVAYDSGGGIVICEWFFTDGSHALIEDGYECLTIFKAPKDEEVPYLPADIIYDKSLDELDSEHRAMYDHLADVLDKYNKEHHRY